MLCSSPGDLSQFCIIIMCERVYVYMHWAYMYMWPSGEVYVRMCAMQCVYVCYAMQCVYVCYAMQCVYVCYAMQCMCWWIVVWEDLVTN